MQNKESDRQRAQKLVRETLEASFDKGSFRRLIKNILNHIDESEEALFDYRGQFIFAGFRGFIGRYERIGKYQSPNNEEIDILIVYLAKDVSLERARSKQRNFVAKYLRDGRGRKLKDAALVAFVAPDQKDWRFSLVKIGYRLEEGEAKEEFTPAQRYSFLVGENENSHTAQSRLLPMCLNEVDPALKDLEEAFSVEKVTKEFFSEYQRLYLSTNNLLESVIEDNAEAHRDFEEKSINTRDFTKKLLGQIAFLYFIQKKGWLGVAQNSEWGTGSKNFLRELFKKKHIEYENFFNDILEPLFYEALRLKQTDDYYERFGCRIPFLNGGLFDPLEDYSWSNIDIQLPNDIFSNNERTREGDIGDGILDVFDRYNFTVKEDEPLEKEVAVDPEMLGKVFESLLEIKERKSKGTYYTPREIVHYMCQESLVNYLDTALDSKIKKEDIKTLVMRSDEILENDSRVIHKGRETERYSFKMPPDIREDAKLIDSKLEEVRICDPAVGSGAFIVGMMSEIVTIRNILTIYIKGNGQEDAGRTPFHFKRYTIQNCLYGVDIDPGAVEIAKLRLWLSLVVDEEERQAIQPLPNLDYKIMQGDSLLWLKRQSDFIDDELLEEQQKLKDKLLYTTNPAEKQRYKEQIDEYDSQLTDGEICFDFEKDFSRVFSDKGGFDIVIANPPYVKTEHLESEDIQKLKDFYQWSDDLYAHFIFRGLDIVCDDGVMCYITNNSFIGLSSKLRVRKQLLQYKLRQLIQCPYETFEAAIYTAVFLLQKTAANTEESYETGSFACQGFAYSASGAVPYKVVHTLPQKRLLFADPMLKVLCKLQNLPKVDEFLSILDIGIHSGNVREKIFFHEKDGIQNPHRLLQGKQIERWGIFWDRPEAKYKYCDIEYQVKPQKGIGRGGKPSSKNEYWSLRDVENHRQPERLLMRQSDDDLLVAYQSEEELGRFYTDNTLFTILSKNPDIQLKYAMAILNSSLLNALYQYLSQEKDRAMAAVKINLVNELPFSIQEPSKLIHLVDKIIAITRNDDYLENASKQAEVHKYEKEIDKIVYQVYGLTDEEIKIVEEW